MLSARGIFEEIRSDDEAYRLFLSVASKGEAQGGWENERIAALTRDPDLAPKIARHGRDEQKHARLFAALLKKRGLDPVQVPPDMDYTMRLERAGIGLAHERLHRDDPMSDLEILEYLAHGRVTEQRGAEEIGLQLEIFKDDPEIGRAIGMIADDEANHLAHCHEELLRFVDRGYGESIRPMLREYALAEIRTYRDVSLAMMTRLAEILGWPWWKTAAIRLGIFASYAVERAWTWRRMVTLHPPQHERAR